MFPIISMLLLTVVDALQVIDYSRKDYVVIENGDVLLYKDYATLFHITNLTKIKYSIASAKRMIKIHHDRTNYPDTQVTDRHDTDFNIIQTLIGQLTITRRNKRAIETIGKIWKWIAGSPDHDDKIIIENKINDLVQNNNKQYLINSKILNLIENFSNSFVSDIIEKQTKLIILELQNLINTITLSKLGIIHPALLNSKDINEIVKTENISLSISDLLDVSRIKILQNKDLIVILIKYPIIIRKCKMFETRAISHEDGKLIIPKNIALCQETYVNVKDCKLELNDFYCKLEYNDSCLSNLLNLKKAKCKKIKEMNAPLEIIFEGHILTSGKRYINNETYEGTNLIIFQEEITVDNTTYQNPTYEVKQYLKGYSSTNFEVEEYLNAINKELEIENISILKSIKTEILKRPITSTTSLTLIIITATVIAALYYKKRKTSRSGKFELRCMRIEKLIQNNMQRDAAF